MSFGSFTVSISVLWHCQYKLHTLCDGMLPNDNFLCLTIIPMIMTLLLSSKTRIDFLVPFYSQYLFHYQDLFYWLSHNTLQAQEENIISLFGQIIYWLWFFISCDHIFLHCTQINIVEINCWWHSVRSDGILEKILFLYDQITV